MRGYCERSYLGALSYSFEITFIWVFLYNILIVVCFFSDFTPDISALMVFLENFKTPWTEVINAWEKTHAARLSYLTDDKIPVNVYMDRFVD